METSKTNVIEGVNLMFSLIPKTKRKPPLRIFPEFMSKILSTCFFAYFATIEPKCNPHITTMFYLWNAEEKTIYLITSKDTRKIRNITRNSSVSVTVDERDPESPARNLGVLIRGRADLHSIEEVGDVLLNKYLEKNLRFLGTGFPMGSRIVIEVTPRIIHYWKGIKFASWKNPNY